MSGSYIFSLIRCTTTSVCIFIQPIWRGKPIHKKPTLCKSYIYVSDIWSFVWSFMSKHSKVLNLLQKELMLRWHSANLSIFFNFKWYRILFGILSEFWLWDCSLKLEVWETDISASFGHIVTDKTKFGESKLSFNRHELLISLIRLMASLSDPLSMRYRPFLSRHFVPILLLSTISSSMEFKWFFDFFTVRDTLSSSVISI